MSFAYVLWTVSRPDCDQDVRRRKAVSVVVDLTSMESDQLGARSTDLRMQSMKPFWWCRGYACPSSRRQCSQKIPRGELADLVVRAKFKIGSGAPVPD